MITFEVTITFDGEEWVAKGTSDGHPFEYRTTNVDTLYYEVENQLDSATTKGA